MVYYAGIDLGKRKSQIKVITSDRKVVEEIKIENDPKAFERVFKKYKGDIEVACEASSNAFWVADLLSPFVTKVHVGHTTKIRWIAEARVKTDRIDAGILAELLRADLFPTIWVPPKRVRELRELVRGVIRLRRSATRCRNQVHGLLGRHGVCYNRGEMAGSKLGSLVEEAGLATPVRIAARAILQVEEAIQKEIKELQAAVRGELKVEPEILKQVGLLETIPGVGFFSAILFVLELWDVSRFRDVAHLASYIGFIPSTHQTGQTAYNGRMTRQGNVLVRWILVQDAWSAVRSNGFFSARYEYYRSRKGGTKAIIPVARALLGTIFQVWTLKKTYEEIYDKKASVG